MDLNSAKILNPWWQNPKAIESDPHLAQIKGQPFYFDHPLKSQLILEPQATFIIRGGRQVGKTTLLKEKIREALSADFPPDHCLYLSCEAFENQNDFREMLSTWISAKKEGPLLLCLDEVTFVTEWQRAFLWIINAGLLQNATTLITGSNARDLKKSAERFPGRHVHEMKVFPLSLNHLVRIECFRSFQPVKLLETYLKVGGFPHAIRDFYQHGFVTDETYEAYANWIFGDAHRFNLLRDLLTHILFRIFETTGTQVTWQRLIEKSPVKSHETAAAYAEHLESAFLCRILNCYDPQKEMSAPRKAKKIYFLDPLLYGVVGGYLQGTRNVYQWWLEKLAHEDFKGKIFESLVVNQFAQKNDQVYYWYSANLKKEVDLLIKTEKEIRLVEVKSSPEAIRPVLGKEVTVMTPESFLSEIKLE